MKILVVEDSQPTALAIRDELRPFATVDVVETAAKAQECVATYTYDVIVLDWVLNDGNGVELCREWREQGISTPILMLTARHHLDEKLEGFSSGVDDYLTKPFHMRELVARVQALSKRSSTPIEPDVLKVGNLVLHSASGKVFYNGQQIELRRKGFLMLEYLMRHVGQVVTREMLAEYIWESDRDPMSNTIEVHIRYLRNKIDRPFRTKVITTVHGLGYRIDKKE